MYKEMKVSAIIVAAGNSTRMGEIEKSKIFLEVKDNSIIEHTLNAFEVVEEIDEIIVVIREEDEEMFRKAIDLNKSSKIIKIVYGGDTREESTWNGLCEIDEETDIIVTHDGARPFINSDIIRNVIYNVIENKAVITAVPVKDTIKIVEQGRNVKYTPKRSTLYLAQTPQAFMRDILLRSYELFKGEQFEVTDDASIVEKAGYKVQMIMGDYKNIKITTVEDVLIGKTFLGEIE